MNGPRSRTIPKLVSRSGKAIKALGKSAIRVAENVTFRVEQAIFRIRVGRVEAQQGTDVDILRGGDPGRDVQSKDADHGPKVLVHNSNGDTVEYVVI